MFENQDRTNLEELGEFGLIGHLTKNIKLTNESSKKESATMQLYLISPVKKCW